MIFFSHHAIANVLNNSRSHITQINETWLRAAIPPAARFGNVPRIIGSGNLVALK
jgi:hypothetical protein